MTPGARRAQLERYAAHYAAKEAEPHVVTGDRDHRNPWTGLRRATERALARLTAQEEACDQSSETTEGDGAPPRASTGA